MGKKEHRGKLGDLIALVIIGGVGYLFLEPTYGKVFIVAAWIFMLSVWVLFFMPTYCDYDVGGRGCSREVYGKFRGCWQHKRLKRDAVWAAFGRRNPGMAVRLTWGDSLPRLGRRVGSDTGISPEAKNQGVYNAANLLVGLGSLFVAVLALLISK